MCVCMWVCVLPLFVLKNISLLVRFEISSLLLRTNCLNMAMDKRLSNVSYVLSCFLIAKNIVKVVSVLQIKPKKTKWFMLCCGLNKK